MKACQPARPPRNVAALAPLPAPLAALAAWMRAEDAASLRAWLACHPLRASVLQALSCRGVIDLWRASRAK